MAKMTKEEKKAQQEAKKAAAKAKREAKKAARLEKLEKKREKKRLAREAKKAKALAKREKAKAKKAKEKERAKLMKAKEKARIQKLTKKDKAPKPAKDTGAVDIREASKTMKKALAYVADTMAKCDAGKRAKKAKAIRGLGYDVEFDASNIIVRFITEKTKKVKGLVPVAPEKPATEANVEKPAVAEPEDAVDDVLPDDENDNAQAVEVPAGDLYGQDGAPAGEVANIDSDDLDDEDDDSSDNDDFIADSRDEQDEDLIDNRREFFGSFGDDGEMNDD